MAMGELIEARVWLVLTPTPDRSPSEGGGGPDWEALQHVY